MGRKHIILAFILLQIFAFETHIVSAKPIDTLIGDTPDNFTTTEISVTSEKLEEVTTEDTGSSTTKNNDEQETTTLVEEAMSSNAESEPLPDQSEDTTMVTHESTIAVQESFSTEIPNVEPESFSHSSEEIPTTTGSTTASIFTDVQSETIDQVADREVHVRSAPSSINPNADAEQNVDLEKTDDNKLKGDVKELTEIEESEHATTKDETTEGHSDQQTSTAKNLDHELARDALHAASEATEMSLDKDGKKAYPNDGVLQNAAIKGAVGAEESQPDASPRLVARSLLPFLTCFVYKFILTITS